MMFGIVIQPIGAPSEGWWTLIGTTSKPNGLRRRYIAWKAPDDGPSYSPLGVAINGPHRWPTYSLATVTYRYA